MDARGSRTGSAVSALGGMLTVISVFLPWYGLSFTSAAVAFAESLVGRFLPQLAGSGLAAQMRQAGNAEVGHQFAAVSARQVFHTGSTLLLIAGGLAVALSLVSLARSVPGLPPGGALVGLGLAAAALIAWHMATVPDPAPGLIVFSLEAGPWLGLCGALAIAAGGLWPASSRSPRPAAGAPDAWAELSGWTPSA